MGGNENPSHIKLHFFTVLHLCLHYFCLYAVFVFARVQNFSRSSRRPSLFSGMSPGMFPMEMLKLMVIIQSFFYKAPSDHLVCCYLLTTAVTLLTFIAIAG
jgi:cellulose synthase/poly-beta-1,6-N-acetylglucosamine synthase-like glycosyltransferase